MTRVPLSAWATHVAKFMLNEIPRLAHKYGVRDADIMHRVPPERLAALLVLSMPKEPK